MQYNSTRGGLGGLTSSEAIKMGLAIDGGLFVPDKITTMTMSEIASMQNMTYQERAYVILKDYLTDFSEEELKECIQMAYSRDKFDAENIVPLKVLNSQVSVLEIWHGPTCAFKDIALQILPHLLVKAMRNTGEKNEVIILVATSGDTGKAALEGFKDVAGTRIIVYFPQDGVSEIQKYQMITQEGKNVYSIAVKGNFDDAQNGVKEIFTNTAFSEQLLSRGFMLSSANSINWGRLVPQIVYYFSAYAELLKNQEINSGDKVNFVVPTGNFGNILAAYIALKMGLPIHRLICASNENNVLTEFISTGIYDKHRTFKKTLSPSMDIIISSNLERLLYFVSGKDTSFVANMMETLKEKGRYRVENGILKTIQSIFWAGCSNDSETIKTIESIYEEYDYVVDTHTAVAIDVYDRYVISTSDMTKTIIVSTASPFKFNSSVMKAIKGEEYIINNNEFELLVDLAEKTRLTIPKGLRNLDKKPICHTNVCEKSQMKGQIVDILGL